jgi:uncharacterized membrane protein YphA (DoxX/SURF4 family)
MMEALLYKLVRYFFAAVFLFSGFSKLADPRAFAVLIEAYGLIPEGLVMAVAIALPVFEIIVALGLIFDVRGSLAAVSGLLVLFLMVLGYGIHLGLDIDCGCFGPSDPEARAYSGLRSAFYRDLVMMAGVFFLFVSRHRRAVKPVGLKFLLQRHFRKEIQT